MFSQRSKILLLCLAALILGFRLYEMSGEYLLGPIAQKRLQIEDLEAELILQKRLSKRIQQVQKEFDVWLEESLPSRQAEAATLYQNWLIDVCRDSRFDDVQVTPSAVEELPMDTKVLSFNVTGSTDFAGMQYFLRMVEETPLLHQVGNVSARLAKSEYDDRLDVKIGLHCMILDGAEERSFLIDDQARIAIEKRVSRLQRNGAKDLLSPFLIVKDKSKPKSKEEPVVISESPAKPSVKPPKPKPDYSGQIVQVGTVMNGLKREVWVMDQRTSKQQVLQEGEDFDFYGLRGTIHSITARYVVIEMDGKSYRWMLAGSLKDRETITQRKRSKT